MRRSIANGRVTGANLEIETNRLKLLRVEIAIDEDALSEFPKILDNSDRQPLTQTQIIKLLDSQNEIEIDQLNNVFHRNRDFQKCLFGLTNSELCNPQEIRKFVRSAESDVVLKYKSQDRLTFEHFSYQRCLNIEKSEEEALASKIGDVYTDIGLSAIPFLGPSIKLKSSAKFALALEPFLSANFLADSAWAATSIRTAQKECDRIADINEVNSTSNNEELCNDNILKPGQKSIFEMADCRSSKIFAAINSLPLGREILKGLPSLPSKDIKHYTEAELKIMNPMNNEKIRKILKERREGKISPLSLEESTKSGPFGGNLRLITDKDAAWYSGGGGGN